VRDKDHVNVWVSILSLSHFGLSERIVQINTELIMSTGRCCPCGVGAHANCVVPELTRGVDIKLNMQVSLRSRKTTV
jgi:hypothetical protein